MYREIALAALLMMASAPTPAYAELCGTATPPSFSPGDIQIIARNEMLGSIVGSDPWLVRNILDRLAQARAARTAPTADGQNANQGGANQERNPDLIEPQRDAAGALELFEMLRRAKAEKESQANNKSACEPSLNRSAEGALGIFDMLKQVKDAKDGKGAPAAK